MLLRLEQTMRVEHTWPTASAQEVFTETQESYKLCRNRQIRCIPTLWADKIIMVKKLTQLRMLNEEFISPTLFDYHTIERFDADTTVRSSYNNSSRSIIAYDAFQLYVWLTFWKLPMAIYKLISIVQVFHKSTLRWSRRSFDWLNR